MVDEQTQAALQADADEAALAIRAFGEHATDGSLGRKSLSYVSGLADAAARSPDVFAFMCGNPEMAGGMTGDELRDEMLSEWFSQAVAADASDESWRALNRESHDDEDRARAAFESAGYDASRAADAFAAAEAGDSGPLLRALDDFYRR